MSSNVDRAIQSALDFLATRERSVLLKREQKQAIVSLLNGEDVLAVLPTGFGKSMIFTVFGIAESEKLEGRPVSVLVICPLKSIISDQIVQLEGLSVSRAAQRVRLYLNQTMSDRERTGLFPQSPGTF